MQILFLEVNQIALKKKVQIFSNHKYLIMILLFMGLHRINKSSFDYVYDWLRINIPTFGIILKMLIKRIIKFLNMKLYHKYLHEKVFLRHHVNIK